MRAVEEAAESPGVMVIRNGTIINATGEGPIPDGIVAIQRGRSKSGRQGEGKQKVWHGQQKVLLPSQPLLCNVMLALGTM